MLPQRLLSSTKLHQNAVKALLQTHLSSPHRFLLVTGGDDNTLVFTVVQLDNRHGQTTPEDYVIFPARSAHAAAITAIVELTDPKSRLDVFDAGKDNLVLLTSGPDQLVRIWRIEVPKVLEKSGRTIFHVDEIGNTYTSVADVTCLEVIERSFSHVTVLVAGVGLEYLRVPVLKGLTDNNEGLPRGAISKREDKEYG